MKVIVLVTHLLGTGHLMRAATLARAFGAAGHDAQVVSGGMPVPHLNVDGFTLTQLPPLRSDGTDFTTLLDAKNCVVTDAMRAERIDMLVSIIRSEAPDVLITELFPFGRRNLRTEFKAALEAAKALPNPPVILSSVRDILAPPSKQAKADFADDMIEAYYDSVLVHSDEAVVPLSLSWSISPTLAEKLRYTGFVAPPSITPHTEAFGIGEILVCAGGGLVGERVFDAVLAFAEGNRHTFRLLIGGDDARRAALRQRAPSNVIIDAPRPEFRSMLPHAVATISMCGYNTALDILQSGVRAVIVPFDDGGEVEQSIRAQALGQIDGIEVIATNQLSNDTLHTALTAALNAPKRDPQTAGMQGSAHSVEIAKSILDQKISA